MIQIGVVGDIHRHFTEEDVAYFNHSDLDLLLFVGDLGNWWPREALAIAEMMSRLSKPALFFPGNHDTIHAFQLLAEVHRNKILARLFATGQLKRARELRRRLGGVIWAGYSTHHFEYGGQHFDVIAGRPLSMGGPDLAFKHYLSTMHGIRSMDESAARLVGCVDRASSEQLIFLAHNGPTGMGCKKSDMWGCDFKPEGGDCGDSDVAQAIDHARRLGKRIIAVVAGHMHQQLRGGGRRRWLQRKDGFHFVNAAYVPRLAEIDGRESRHFVRVEFDGKVVTVREQFV